MITNIRFSSLDTKVHFFNYIFSFYEKTFIIIYRKMLSILNPDKIKEIHNLHPRTI